MFVRKALESDIPRMTEIYAMARTFMAEHGNPEQWGADNWPPEYLIRDDINARKSYVCVDAEDGSAGRIVGAFYFDFGEEPEPDYRAITGGAWQSAEPYGVVHRIASDHSRKGIGTFCINWAFAQCGHLRIDTHGENNIMQNLVSKLGFVHCGTIYVEEDDYPRLAFEKSAEQ